MKRTLLTFLILTIAGLTYVHADTGVADVKAPGKDSEGTNLSLTVDGVTYSNVTFGVATSTSVSFRHSTGAASVPLAKLPPALQRQFRYDTKVTREAGTNHVSEVNPSAEVARLKAQFEAELVAIDKGEADRLDQARQDYLLALVNLQKEATSRGDLDLVLVAKAERERVVAGTSADFTGQTPQPLWNAKVAYWEAHTNITGQAAAQRAASANSYEQTFADLKVSLTKREDLEGAILAKQEETLARGFSSKSKELPPKPVAAAQNGEPFVPAAVSSRDIGARKSLMMAAGVGRIGVAAFNVAGSPFGEYDKGVIRKVQSRWYALIQQNGLYERSGTVTLHFNLLQNGSVQDIEFKENTAGEFLGLFCQKAVVDSSPFPLLPQNLRALIGDDPREVNFTFYY